MLPPGSLAIVSPEQLGDGLPPLRVDLSDGGTAWLLRNAGALVAYRNLCPHLDAPLDGCGEETWDASAALLVCSFHGATFAPADGRCIEGPCRGSRLEALEVEPTPAGLLLRPAPRLRLNTLIPRPDRP